MNIRQIFENVAQQLPAESVRLAGDRFWHVAIGGEDVTVIASDDDPSLVAVATIGSYAGVTERGMLLEDALKANRFWDETRGATLSVNPETGDLTLADRREREWIADDSTMMEFLSTFAAVAHSWRQYVAGCTSIDTTEPSEPMPEDSVGEEIRIMP